MSGQDEEYEDEPVIELKVMRIARGMPFFDVFERTPGIAEHKVLDCATPDRVEAYLTDFENRAWW